MQDTDTAAPTCRPIARWKVGLVWIVAALLIAIHGYDMLTQTEQWPFSYYQMYARTQTKPQLKLLSLFGVKQYKNNKIRVERITESVYVPPLGEARLRNMLMAAYRNGTEPKNIRDTSHILRDYLNLYEARRLTGLHDGAPMIEARLYRLTWRLKEKPENQKPIRSDLLLSVTSDGKIELGPTTEPATNPAEDANASAD